MKEVVLYYLLTNLHIALIFTIFPNIQIYYQPELLHVFTGSIVGSTLSQTWKSKDKQYFLHVLQFEVRLSSTCRLMVLSAKPSKQHTAVSRYLWKVSIFPEHGSISWLNSYCTPAAVVTAWSLGTFLSLFYLEQCAYHDHMNPCFRNMRPPYL